MKSSFQDYKKMKYAQYTDYFFKSVVRDRLNGVLSFLKIPHKIDEVIMNEFSQLPPKINRLDFAGISVKNGEEICVIIEYQSTVPTEEDIERFFQYVSSLRQFKRKKIELYILCTEKVDSDVKEVILNDESKYVMHMISLKNIKAKDIFNNIENKLKNNEEITDEDIASLQLIAYTDYDESSFEILKRARFLLEDISTYIARTHDDKDLEYDLNDKTAIVYLFDILSVNMLNDVEQEKYLGETEMLLNPVERYYKKEGRQEGFDDGLKEGRKGVAFSLIEEGFSIDEALRISNLKREDLFDSK